MPAVDYEWGRSGAAWMFQDGTEYSIPMMAVNFEGAVLADRFVSVPSGLVDGEVMAIADALGTPAPWEAVMSLLGQVYRTGSITYTPATFIRDCRPKPWFFVDRAPGIAGEVSYGVVDEVAGTKRIAVSDGVNGWWTPLPVDDIPVFNPYIHVWDPKAYALSASWSAYGYSGSGRMMWTGSGNGWQLSRSAIGSSNPDHPLMGSGTMMLWDGISPTVASLRLVVPGQTDTTWPLANVMNYGGYRAFWAGDDTGTDPWMWVWTYIPW